MAYYEDLIVLEKGEIECQLCNIIIPDENKYILAHINDVVHKSMDLKRIMLRNNISLLNGNILCFICKEKINNEAEITAHIKSSSHGNSIQSITNLVEKDGGYIDLPEDITDQGSEVYCRICDENIAFTHEGILRHIVSLKHKRARSITVQPYNGIFSVENNDDDLWCKICQVFFQNYVEIILEHVDQDMDHVQKLNSILDLIKGQQISINKYLTIANEDKAVCEKCNIYVPCSVDNIKAHINGKKHK